VRRNERGYTPSRCISIRTDTTRGDIPFLVVFLSVQTRRGGDTPSRHVSIIHTDTTRWGSPFSACFFSPRHNEEGSGPSSSTPFNVTQTGRVHHPPVFRAACFDAGSVSPPSFDTIRCKREGSTPSRSICPFSRGFTHFFKYHFIIISCI
jgi:hypothetical protein